MRFDLICIGRVYRSTNRLVGPGLVRVVRVGVVEGTAYVARLNDDGSPWSGPLFGSAGGVDAACLSPVEPTPEAAPVLARAFAEVLREDLSEDEIAEVVRRNAANANPDVCATHDFTDANEVMAEAWIRTFGEESAVVSPEDPRQDSHIALWVRAWDIARAAGFFA